MLCTRGLIHLLWCGGLLSARLSTADMEGEDSLLRLLGSAEDEQPMEDQSLPWESEDSVGPSAVVVPGQHYSQQQCVPSLVAQHVPLTWSMHAYSGLPLVWLTLVTQSSCNHFIFALDGDEIDEDDHGSEDDGIVIVEGSSDSEDENEDMPDEAEVGGAGGGAWAGKECNLIE